ncbi:hypothetical protein, partial [Pantoea ananatis]|uniref:hypothetical protein n=2 Tax=Erwiniaceae TaxID=1903409 RepID=UPI001B302BA0
HGDVLMWLMKTLLTSRCINQRGAGQNTYVLKKESNMKIILELIAFVIGICVVLPLYVVFTLGFMVLCTIAIPLKIPAVERKVRRFLKRQK